MRPTSPAVRCRLRRPPDPAADEPGHPIALDLAAPLPHLHDRPPGDPDDQYRRGCTPGIPAPPVRLSARRPARRPAPGRRPGGQAAVQDAHQAVAKRAQRLVVAGTAGAGGVVAAPRTRRARKRRERPQVAGIHQPLVTRWRRRPGATPAAPASMLAAGPWPTCARYGAVCGAFRSEGRFGAFRGSSCYAAYNAARSAS
jgi:hypothetical protein